MIGIVAVSHSARLGEAALELALQMVPGGGVQVRVAAGAGVDAEGAPILGTDAVAVSAAIDELAPDVDGVLVLMDLGSAVLSAELALELRSSDVPVRLAPAPFVEGLLAAVVAAAAGGDLDMVAAEASSALAAKTGQLLPPDAEGTAAADSAPVSAADASASPDVAGETVSRRVRVRNPLGIHARPAALIAESAAGADVRLRRLPDGQDAAAGSLTRLLALGARQGTEIELTGRGADAEAAIDRLVSLFQGGFGEGVDTDEGAAEGTSGWAPSNASNGHRRGRGGRVDARDRRRSRAARTGGEPRAGRSDRGVPRARTPGTRRRRRRAAGRTRGRGLHDRMGGGRRRRSAAIARRAGARRGAGDPRRLPAPGLGS